MVEISYPAWSEEIHAPLSIQESFLGTNLLTLTYFFFLYVSMNVLNHQRQSELGHCRSIYSLYCNSKAFSVLFSM